LVKQASRQRYQPLRKSARDVLAGLFPETDGPVLPSPLRGRPLRAAAAGVIAFAVGAVVLLRRVPGPPWRAFYAEDLRVFFTDALAHPWHLLAPYAGYLELLQRLVAQAATYVPLRMAPVVFTFAGAAVASGCALFVFHASAGHVRSAWWRALLAAAVLLLPIAPLEIADNTVNAPWYLLIALFWAVLWRPRTRAGMAVAALLAFFAAASDPLAVVLAPLLAARVVALRRFREHAVTAGWLAGLALQAPIALAAAAAAHRSRVARPVPPGQSLAFYGHDVVLPSLGWHLAWHLMDLAGRNVATLIVGCVLAAVFALIIVTQRGRVRLFVVTALVTGLVFTLVAATFSGFVPASPETPAFEPGSRYTVLPIFLFVCAVVVAVDAMVQRARPVFGDRPFREPLRGVRLRAVAAGAALVVVLCAGWAPDFRYLSNRTGGRSWAPIAASWLRACERPGTSSIFVPGWSTNPAVKVPCARLRR
jgi:hypothetical protein